VADELYVLNEGETLPTNFATALTTGTFNTATSTNPFVVTTNGSHSTSENFNYYEVYDGEVSSFGGTTAAINTSTTNAQETPGYRIQLDTGNVNGFIIDANYHYFVLVYSDSIYKHHFAKYTEQTKYDGTVYNIDFTPRLKENIPVGTQVKIFKGPLVSSSIVAAGYGLINDTDTSEERHDKFVGLSRPTFYFLSGDKLEPNHKYSIVKRLYEPTGPNTVNSYSFFKTAPLTSDYILDKSFYTQNATIVDNNKNLDNQSTPQLRNPETGTGATYTFDPETWEDSSRNIYYSDSGHTTYLGFIDSPVRNQLIPSAINIKTNKTLTNRGNYFEAKFSDVSKFLDKKVRTNERVQVKEGIKRQNITYTPNAVLPGIFNNHSISSYITVSGLAENQDLRKLLFKATNPGSAFGNYEPIYISPYYYTIAGISPPTDGEQGIAVSDRREISSATFEGSNTVASITDATAFRKEWSPVVNNFITTHSIDIEQVSESVISNITNGSKTITVSSTNLEVGYEVVGTGITTGTTIIEIPNLTSVVVSNPATTTSTITLTYRANKRNGIIVSDLEADINDLEYRIDGTNYGFSINVKRGDLHNGYVEFENAPTSSYYASTDIVSSLKGKLDVNKIVFEGRVETLEKKIENNLHYITLSGRDDIGKLLSKPVDKNYLYSNEYVYSTISPFYFSYTDTGLDIQDTNNTYTSNISVTGTLGMDIKYGDVLYVATTAPSRQIMIGVAGNAYTSGTSPSNIQLLNDCMIDTNSDYFGNGYISIVGDIYVANKSLIAGKSLNTDLRNNKTTTLYGSLDKGYRLLGKGKFLNDDGSGEKTQTINSFNGTGNEINTLLTTQGSSINKKDSPIGFSFEETTINSLGEHEFLSSQTNEETGLLSIEIGYVSPLVLGRMDDNNSDNFYDNSLGLYLINSNGLGEGGFIHLLDNINVTGAGSPMLKGPNSYRNIIMDDRDSSTRVGANYVMRFGSPIFRFNNLTNSSLSYSRKYQTKVFQDEEKDSTFNIYSNNPKSFNFYSSVFRIEGKSVLGNNYYSDTINSNLKELPLEKTGYYPVLGSMGIDITNYPDVFKNSRWHVWPNAYFSKDIMDNKKYFEIDDPAINTSFLFAIGDALPESKLRRDNIFNTSISRNVENYYLLVKYKSLEDATTKIDHEMYKGKSVTKTYKDSDYEYLPIQGISNSNPKRMNMLRLRTMTVDNFMNEVDFENYQTKSFPADTEYGKVYIPVSIPHSGHSPYPCNITVATTASTTITVDSNHGIDITVNGYNSLLFTSPADDSEGYSRYLGKVSSTTSTDTITLTSNCAVVGYTGEIFAIPDYTSLPSPTPISKYKNEENYIFPDTQDTDFKSHNPNIHLIARDGTSASKISLNNRRDSGTIVARDASLNRVVVFRNVNITMTSINLGSPPSSTVDTARITIDDYGGVSPDLSDISSHVAQVTTYVTISGYTGSDSGKNQEYSITAVGSNYLDISTVALDGLLGMVDDVSSVTCSLTFSVNKYLHATFANRMWQDGTHNAYGNFGSSVNNSIFTGMECVVVRNGQQVTSTTDTSLQPLMIMKREGFLQDNNYGTAINGSSIDVDASEDAFFTLDTGKYFGDTTPYSTGGASPSSELEGDNVELLFIPIIHLAASNISTEVGTGIVGDSDYDSKKYYIKIEVDYTDMHNNNNNYTGPSGSEHRWINYIGSLTGKYLRRSHLTSPSLHYIVNHHISKRDTDTKFIHYLEIDNGFSFDGTEIFEVLTVCSKTTQEDKKLIVPYDYSQTNVINPITGKFYTKENPNRHWTATSTAAGTLKFFTTGHAKVQAMYVFADLDGMSTTLVHRNNSDFRASGFFEIGNTYSVCLSDGINKKQSSMEVGLDLTWSGGGFSPYIYFDNMGEYYGSVSIGETFTVETIGKNIREIESVKLVLPFEIQTEAEEIADDIISSIGLTYNKSQDYGTAEHDKYYIGSNFDGQDAFSAINSVLDYKDLKLIVDGESFKIVSNEDNKQYRNIKLAEDSVDYNITSFKRDISLYDKFNSVVVIGDKVRGIAKNHSEIEADGSEKIKEIYDFSITGQTQADERAKKALKAFSTLSNAIQIEVSSDIPHIQPGQIIELKFEREGIFRGDYVVIEVTKESGYPTKLLLGEYNKDLSTTIALLMGETRNLQGRNKQVYKSYVSPSISLQRTRLKFVRATITSNSGITTIGFNPTIGFNMELGL